MLYEGVYSAEFEGHFLLVCPVELPPRAPRRCRSAAVPRSRARLCRRTRVSPVSAVCEREHDRPVDCSQK